ncbi:MAG: L-rhamnose/proton symporter RhaT [Planctomycetota bacterium]
MQADPFLGVLLHATGGLAAASFYIPYKRVKQWQWENYWLAGGVFSWVLAPWAFALLIVPETLSILAETPLKTLFWMYLFGVMWGIGGLTFGLTMRYLGIALGYAIALGLCALFGTLMPPLFEGRLPEVAHTTGGQVLLAGVVLCLVGISLSGQAGMRKEHELTDEQKKASVEEFHFWKGLAVAILAGVMSASMSYGIAAGKPLGETAIALGTPALWQNLPVLVVVLLGGFTTNFLWCLVQMLRKRTLRDYVAGSNGAPRGSLGANYLFCALAGVTWYLQFFFYSMGTTKMGPFDFSSWTLHMASIIIFSTLWGLALREWRGVSILTRVWIASGLAVLILSTVMIGYGNKLAVPSGG